MGDGEKAWFLTDQQDRWEARVFQSQVFSFSDPSSINPLETKPQNLREETEEKERISDNEYLQQERLFSSMKGGTAFNSLLDVGLIS